MRTLAWFLLAAGSLAAQPVPAGRLTFTGGWTRQVGGYAYEEKQTAPGLGLSYGYRFRKHVEAEAGLFTALDPTGNQCSRFGCVDAGDRFWWIPFGVRFVAPLYLNRIEFSGGGGGLYEKYTVGTPAPGGGPSPRAGWGGYVLASAAISLDHARRFWLGFAPRLFLANPEYARDRWLQIAGELSVRFGRR